MSANARDMGSISGLGRSEKEMEMEMEMENHSSVLAWEITWTRTLVGYSPLGHNRVGHNLVTKKNKQTKKKIQVHLAFPFPISLYLNEFNVF